MNTQNYNPIADTDSYKPSQWLQYPPGTEYIYSYVESRGGEYDKTVFFGLQMFIKQYLSVQIKPWMIEEAAEMFKAHGIPFNREGWEYIVNELDGKIPLEIKAVPEGTVVDTKNVLATVVNTDPKCFWVTSYFETAILRAIWYPTTVATQSKIVKNKISIAMDISSDDIEKAGLAFKLHDFGARGVSSMESAAIGGLAHLVNFMGTDTISALIAGRRFYNAPMAGFSIPATEHSTITSWGKDGEEKAYRNFVEQYGGTYPIIACVIDSYNDRNAVDNIIGNRMKEMILQSGSMFVARPDSGDPVEVVIDILKSLWKSYGGEINNKGYKVLDNVRVIQGDGINPTSLGQIVDAVIENGFSIDNVAFGMGGGLLQQVDRDTQQFAMKCSAIKVGDEWRDVFKTPVGDQSKASKKGILSLNLNDGKYQTLPYSVGAEGDQLKTVFRNGELIREYDFDEVRANSNK